MKNSVEIMLREWRDVYRCQSTENNDFTKPLFFAKPRCKLSLQTVVPMRSHNAAKQSARRYTCSNRKAAQYGVVYVSQNQMSQTWSAGGVK